MNSQDSNLVLRKFLERFTLELINITKKKNFSKHYKHIIHADLVPRVSEKVIQMSMEKETKQKIHPHQAPQQMVIQKPQTQKNQPMPTDKVEGFEKINLLLHDPSVSTIECPGPERPLNVIIHGQKRMTKIILSPKQISEILNYVSEKVHIPVLEGVFRASTKEFSLNAVISDIIGSRFVLQKH